MLDPWRASRRKNLIGCLDSLGALEQSGLELCECAHTTYHVVEDCADECEFRRRSPARVMNDPQEFRVVGGSSQVGKMFAKFLS